MAQTPRRLRVLSIGYPPRVGQFYVRFGVVRKQSEKISKEQFLRGNIVLGTVKSLRALRSLGTLRTLKILAALRDYAFATSAPNDF